MGIRIIMVIIFLSAGCKSDVINCPDFRPLRLKKSNPFRAKNNKNIPTLSASSHTTEKRPYTVRDKSPTVDPKKSMYIEDWDCPRPGAQRNKKIMKESIKRMERQMKEDTRRKSSSDTLSILPAIND